MIVADTSLVEESRPMAGKYLTKYRPTFMESERNAASESGQSASPAITA